jgi:hypothetical protein
MRKTAWFAILVRKLLTKKQVLEKIYYRHFFLLSSEKSWINNSLSTMSDWTVMPHHL